MKKILFIFCLAIFCYNCAWDEADPAESICFEGQVLNYSDVADIITSKCSQSSCHDGTRSIGNYRTYDGVVDVLDNGEFERWVFVTERMPEPGSPPLTEEESQMLRCWLENGHPNN